MSDASVGQGAEREQAVYRRYAAASEQVEAELCCPVDYDPTYLEVIPPEVLARDYGCGNPAEYVRPGETVLDLGSGGGKACFIMAQKVGPQGQVIGVDCNQPMLELARRSAPQVAERVGYQNVQFRCGLIQDLRLDLDLLDAQLQRAPIHGQADWLRLRSLEEQLRRERPLVADASIDCVVSNCVLNLVRPQDRRQLFGEILRVLKAEGRAVISDIVSDEDVPDRMRRDGQLWSGCISGAYREDRFLQAFEEAGFHGIELVKREPRPWRTVEGIEFRSVTVVAYKGKQGPCLERNQALIYRGPFKTVEDDDGHLFHRGQRMAVCDKTFHLLSREPYSGAFEAVAPREEVPLDKAQPFDCHRSTLRDPRETKGQGYQLSLAGEDDCCGRGGCC